MKKDEKILRLARQRYEEAETAWGDQQNLALEDIRFARLGEQWDEVDRQSRATEGRPCLTINRLPAFIRQVVNDARQNTPSITVHPVDSKADPETAEIISDLIRNIEYTSDAEVSYDSALEDAVTCGWGFFKVGIEYATDDAFDLDIVIERIPNPLSVTFDPSSTAADASDWRYAFVSETLSHEEFKARFPNAELSDWQGDYDDWLGEDTIRVAEYWERKEEDALLLMLSNGTALYEDQYLANLELFQESGLTVERKRKTRRSVVTHRLISGSEVLEETSWPGKYIPICPVFGDEIWEEGQRHFVGLTRPARDAQRNYNYWRTAATEKVALSTKAPWIGPAGAFDTDHEKWETANTTPHAYIEYDGAIPPQQTPPSMVDAGAIQEALSASDDMKSIMGLYDASLGARSNETSGRAILARQREGDVSTFHFIDNLSRAIRYCGRVLLDLIPKVYDQPRMLRVMGYDESVKNVQINQEFDAGGMIKIHDLTAGKYDLTVKAGPSFTTKREEAATTMTEMVRAFPQLGAITGDLIAQNMDWPGADEMAKRLKVMLPPEIQALEKMDNLPPQAQAMIAQAQAQVKQLTDVLQQGKQLLAESQSKINGLELEKKSKADELQVKTLDIQKRYETAMAQIQKDLQIAHGQETEENRRLVIKEALDILEQRMAPVAEVQSAANLGIEQLMAQVSELAGQITASKSISIVAPSGKTYTGHVEAGEVQITTPTGETYEGTVH